MQIQPHWVSSLSYWLSNKRRRLSTTSSLFAVLISNSQMGMSGKKHWWWTVNIRSLLVMSSYEGELKKNYNIQPVWKIAYKNSLALLFDLHSTGSSETKAKKARLKYLGSRCSSSGVGIFFYGENFLWNCEATHQNAKRNYFYANIVCCKVNYPEHCRWLNQRLHWVSEYDEVFMIHCCVRLHRVVYIQVQYQNVTQLIAKFVWSSMCFLLKKQI